MTTQTLSSVSPLFAPRSIRAFVFIGTLAGTTLLLTAGCGNRDATDTVDARGTATEPTPTRGPTGAGPASETQGAPGMFEAEPGDPAAPNTYATTGEERRPVPSEQWDDTALGDEYRSAYTTKAGPAEARTVDTPTDGDRDVARGDDALAQQVRDELRRSTQELALNEEQVSAIHVEVANSRVTLTGLVPNQAAADRIEQHVDRLPGVQSVENQLRTSAGTVAE